jgi:glycosyltransferase involved in cell wall biosynthesis
MIDPFFSIVIPSFNQSLFLEECIKSILEQDFKDFQLILIDGGSTDGSLSIIHQYQDFFYYWQSNPDRGQADAISQGFKHATGQYFLWLNSDDILLPCALSTYHNVLSSSPNVHFLYGNMKLISPYSKEIGRRFLTPLPPFFPKLSVKAGLFGFYQPASVWSSAVYDVSGGINPNMQFALDNDLFIRITGCIDTHAIFHLDRYVAAFRVHQHQKTSRISSVGSDERKSILQSLPFPLYHLLQLWVRSWRVAYYLRCGKALSLLNLLLSSNTRSIP